MPENTLPRSPVEHWERERAEWVAAVTRLVDEAQQWSSKRGWWVHRESKTVTDDDDRIGTYEVPLLRIQTPNARLLVEPIARYVVGALGRIDLAVFPSYHCVPILRRNDGWWIGSNDRPEQAARWSEESLVERATRLVSHA